jgi:hypothetical protein
MPGASGSSPSSFRPGIPGSAIHPRNIVFGHRELGQAVFSGPGKGIEGVHLYNGVQSDMRFF